MATQKLLLFRLAEYLRTRKESILADAASMLQSGAADLGGKTSDFPWPKRLGQVVLETADWLLVHASREAEGGAAETPEERPALTGVQAVLLESASIRSALLRALNRFQSEQGQHHDFTALEMTEARQQTLQEFDILLALSLSEWLTRENARTASINPHAVQEVYEGLKGVLGLLRLTTESVPPSQRIHIAAAVNQLTRLAARLQEGASIPPGAGLAPVAAPVPAPQPPAAAPKPVLPAPRQEPLRLAPLHIATFIRTLAEAFRPAAEQKGLRFETRCLPHPEVIQTDAAKLHRAASLILDHAVRSTLSGTVTLSAGVQRAGRWTLVVRDTGPGIAPELLSRMLLGLGQGDSEQPGLDGVLGIALARDLTELLGGVLEAESTSQNGTQFRIDLPLH